MAREKTSYFGLEEKFLGKVKGRRKQLSKKEKDVAFEESLKQLRILSKNDFWVFASEVMRNRVYDPWFHRLLSSFVMHGEEGTPELPAGDYFWPTRQSLQDSGGKLHEAYRIGDPMDTRLHERLRTKPTALDGSFRGMFMRIRKDAKYKICLVPRGHLKTTMLTVARILWLLVRDPSERILAVMNSGTNARNVIRDIQSHFETNEVFRRVFPDLIPPHLRQGGKRSDKAQIRWQADRFDIPTNTEEFMGMREASVVGLGINGRLVSQHYTRRCYDDVVDDKSVGTPEQVKKRIRDYQALQALGVGDVTTDMFVGTPWDYSDLTQFLIDPSLSGLTNTNVVIATVMMQDDRCIFPKQEVVNGEPIKGHPGFTPRLVKRIKNIQRRSGLFSSQYLMQPISTEDQAFKAKWWKFYNEIPPGASLATVMTVDPAISEKRSGDFSAFVVVSIDTKGNWYVREIIRHRGLGAPGILETIYALYDKWSPDLVGIEAVSFQKSISFMIHDQSLSRGRPLLPIVEVTPSTRESKEFRIRRISPRVRAGLVFLPVGDPSVPYDMSYQRPCLPEGIQCLVSEGERFPKLPNDDVIDALSMVIDVNILPSISTKTTTPKTIHEEIMEQHKKGKGPSAMDSVLGTEW